jgi:hypothetical protein
MSIKTSHPIGTVNTEKDMPAVARKRTRSTTGQGTAKTTQKSRTGAAATQRKKSFVL